MGRHAGRSGHNAIRRLSVRYSHLCCRSAVDRPLPRKSHSKSQRGQTSGDSQLRQATVEAVQRLGEPSPATPSDARDVTGVKGSPVQIRPSRLAAKLFRIYLHHTRPTKEPFRREMALLGRTLIICPGVLPGYLPRRRFMTPAVRGTAGRNERPCCPLPPRPRHA